MKISHCFTSTLVISLLSIAVIATAIIHPGFSFSANAKELFSNVNSNAVKTTVDNSNKNGQSSLANLLNPDGTLNLFSGLNGSFNPQGYRMTYGANGAPVFMQTTSNPDNNWEVQFAAPGIPNGFVSGVAANGNDIYFGGTFTAVAGVNANNIAKWNGTVWSALGSGLNGAVYDVAVIGTDVYVAGNFTEAGGVSANNIAKWNGSSWSALGSGINGLVYALAVSGNDLYVGGNFSRAGGVNAKEIAKWNGTTWSALGIGVNESRGFPFDGDVWTLAANGTDLYVGGRFDTAGGVNAAGIAKWNGSSWSALGSGLAGTFRDSPVGAIAVSGNDVYVGGNFTTAGGVSANNIAKWNGTAWSALGSGMSSDFGVSSAYVHSIHINGNDVYVGGSFMQAGNVNTEGIAKWNAGSWSALGSGIRGNAYGFAVVDNYLYVAGAFIRAGDKAANNIARYALRTVISNTAPMISAGAALTRQQGGAASTATVIATVSDRETAAGSLTVTATTIPTGLTITNISNTNGTVSAQIASGCNATVGANTVVLTVSDGTATATANLTVNVTANTAPLAPLYNPITINVGQSSLLTPFTLGSDNGFITNVTLQTPAGFTGTISYNPGNEFITISNAGPAGTYTVQLLATDNCGALGGSSFQLTVSTPANTTTGPNVAVTSNNTTVTFSNVTTAGNTTITPITPAAAGTLPNGYTLANGNLAFEITTTAVFSGPITLTFNVPGVTDAAVFSTLRVLHGEGSPQALVDRTVLAPNTPAPNFATRQISARVTSLSPFVIATTQSIGCTGINYSAATNLRVGTSPYSVVTGDFNGDGKLDLATANLDSNTVSVLTNNGVGGFTGPINFGVGRFPNSLTVGDFNGDGKGDLAVAKSGSSTISIISGDLTGSTGNYSVTPISLGFRQPQFVASGDFNGDGKADLATANTDSNTVSILLGDGAGGFGGRTDIAIFDTPNSVIIGDFNSDGKTDLFALDGRSGSVLRGDGAGGFSVVSKTEGGNAATTKDFNSDGKPDLAITQSNGTVSIYLGNGTGEFSVSGIVTVGDNPFGIIDGDFNGDGKADIATANASSDNVSILPGNGTGGFGIAINFAVGPAPVALIRGDFNNDGKADLATANAGSNNVSILFATCGGAPNNSPPTITAAPSLTRQQGSPGPASTIATVNDTQTAAGSLIVTATTVPTGITITNITNTTGTITANVAAAVNATIGNNTLVLTVTDGGGLTATANLIITVTAPPPPPPPTGCAVTQLQQPTNYTTAETPSDVSYGDFNGDGKPDLVTSNYEANAISVMLNNGSGGFAPAVIYPVGSNPKSVTVGDLNGDGKLDLVVTNLVGGDLSILLGNGNGGFTPAPKVTGMSYPVSVAIGDLNGDGKPDLVIANAGSYQTTAVFGNGDGTFTFGFEFFKHEGGMPAAIVMADFDKDGRLDFAVAYNNTNRAIVYFNRPGSYIDDARILDAGDQPLDMVGGDFNGDGFTDLAVANYASNDVTYLTNTRTANFIKTSSAVGSLPRSLSVTNFNGDNLDDLVVANDGTNFVTKLTSNSSAAPTRQDLVANESPSAVTATDFNGDGKSDVIVADYWVNRITTYQGACVSAFAPEMEAIELKNLRYVRSKFAGDPFTRNNRTGRGSTQRSR